VPNTKPQTGYEKLRTEINADIDAIQRKQRKQAGSSDGWPKPEPLQGELPPVKAFDPTLLPESLRELAVDVAERMQVPLDFVAALMVLCLAGRHSGGIWLEEVAHA
jgi:hypothetical protein